MDRHYRSSVSPSGSLPSTRSSTPVSSSGSLSGRLTPDRHGIQSTIQQLADEQERVQKKTFTNWMNTYLSQHVPPMKVEDLFSDIKNGLVLLYLLEVLTGEKLPMEKGTRMKRLHFLSNISCALSFLERKKIKLVNINPSDIADGKPTIVLGLIWTIILYLQIDRITIQSQSEESAEGQPMAKKGPKESVKKALLNWTTNAVTKHYGIPVTDFGKSWRDGVAFNAMIHNIRPDLVDLEKTKRQSARVNLEYAFTTAEDQLGIPRLIDAEDVDVLKPDEKSIMTYVAQFLKAYPEAGENPEVRKKRRSMDTPETEMQQFQDLLKWLETAENTLQIIHQPLTEREPEYLEFSAFKVEYDVEYKVYRSLKQKIISNKSLKLTLEDYKFLKERWLSVQHKIHLWLLKLDRSLPGEIGTFAEWLYKAEEFLERDLDSLEDPNKMIMKIHSLMVEHQEIFKDLPSYLIFMNRIMLQGVYHGEQLPMDQIEHMQGRLHQANDLEPDKMSMLTFLKSRFGILVFLDQTEAKYMEWSKKFSSRQNVHQLQESYQGFVIEGGIDKIYQSTSATLKSTAQVYLKTEVGKENSDDIHEFIENCDERWIKMYHDIEMAGKVIDESSEFWKQHDVLNQKLNSWLSEAQMVLKKPSPEKQIFFQDLPEWQENHKSYNEACFYLADVVEPLVIAKMNHEMERINQAFRDIVISYHQYLEQLKDVEAQSYKDSVTEVAVWLTKTNGMLNKIIPCSQKNLQHYEAELDSSSKEVSDMEHKLKSTSRTGHALAKTSPRETATQISETLKKYTETFKSNKKSIAEKMKYIKILLPNIESFEHGITAINVWLDVGETLIQKQELNEHFDKVENWLEAHKEHFSQTESQRSMLESKRKLLQKMISHKTKLNVIDFEPPQHLLQNTTSRFQTLKDSACESEKKLEEAFHLWQVYCQHYQQIDDWMEQAETVLTDSDDDIPDLIQKLKAFFDGDPGDSLWQKFHDSSIQLLRLIPGCEAPQINKTVDIIKNKLKELEDRIPARQMYLDFQYKKSSVYNSVNEAKTVLEQNKNKLNSGDHVDGALQKHKKYFTESFYISLNGQLEEMHQICLDFSSLDPQNQTLTNEYRQLEIEWKEFCNVINSSHLELKQLPKRWDQYNIRYEAFSKTVCRIEILLIEMQKPLSDEEYQKIYSEFQELMKDMEKYGEESKWLTQNLDSLLEDTEDKSMQKESNNLKMILEKFNTVKPSVVQISSKSSVFSKCFQFREDLDRKSHWLEETHQLIVEKPYVDGLEEAQTMLQEHESVMKKLDIEGENIKANLTTGEQLLEDTDAPSFVATKTAELNRKWTTTIKEAEEKYQKLTQTAKDWKCYEDQKCQVLQNLSKAEIELEKEPVGGGHDLAKKDFEVKKDLQQTIENLRESLNEMQKLNSLLCEGASQEGRVPLKREITMIDQKLESVYSRLTSKLVQLEGTITRWSQYYSRLNNFSTWLEEKERQLIKVKEDTEQTPEKQLLTIETICNEVKENQVTLDNLEEDAKDLVQNFRSRETAALKSKLATIRRLWQQLVNRADDYKSSYSGSVCHWKTYNQLLAQLMPWIESAQKYCTQEVPLCSSLDESTQLYDDHQSFIQEYEHHSLLFESLCGEGQQVTNQPEVRQQIDQVQQQLNEIQTSTEKKTIDIEERQFAFVSLATDLEKFKTFINKYETKLYVTPVINTIDLKILNHELALSKVLNEEIHNNNNNVELLKNQFAKMKFHTNSVGTLKLEECERETLDSWNKIRLLSDERQATVTLAVKSSEEFVANSSHMEHWIQICDQNLTRTSEIYSDDIPNVQQEFQTMLIEWDQNSDNYKKLSSDFQHFINNCSEDEAAVLKERFDHMSESFHNIKELSASRQEACQKWVSYSEINNQYQIKLKQLQQRLSSSNIKESEILGIMESIQLISGELKDWNDSIKDLDSLMKTSYLTIKDRATQRSLHFHSELQNIQSFCKDIHITVSSREEKLGEMSKLWKHFDKKRNDLIEKLDSFQKQVNSLSVENSSFNGITDIIDNIEKITTAIYKSNPQYEEVRDLGRLIIQNDNSQSSEVQSLLEQLNDVWETLQALLREKHNYYNSLFVLWKQFLDASSVVRNILETEQVLAAEKVCFTSPEDVKKALEQRKAAEFELHATQTQLDYYNNKGAQLLQDLARVPKLDSSDLEKDINTINETWETTNDNIILQKENCEAQLVCWDQLLTGIEEIKNWIVPLIKRFESNLNNFEDTITVGTRLQSYQEELPYFAKIFIEVQQKIKDLQDLNGSIVISSLTQSENEIKQHFEHAEKLVKHLEEIVGDFSTKYQILATKLEEETIWLTSTKNTLLIFNDISNTEDNVVDQINQLKDMKQELVLHESNSKSLLDSTDNLQKTFQSAEASNLFKDAQIHHQKMDSLSSRLVKTENILFECLELNCKEYHQKLFEKVEPVTEKLSWCNEGGIDLQAIEIRLKALNDLLFSVSNEEEDRLLMLKKAEQLSAVLPEDKQRKLEQQRNNAKELWDSTILQMGEIKILLENRQKQQKEYNHSYEMLSNWMKKAENRLKDGSSLKPDLPKKEDHLEFIKGLREEASKSDMKFEALKEKADSISKSVSDARTASLASQLYSRYTSYCNTLKEQMLKAEQNIEEHKIFDERCESCSSWLISMEERLRQCSDKSNNEKHIQAKMQKINDLMKTKDEGLDLLNLCIESSEKLFLNTAKKGREKIRQHVQQLQKKWETFSEKLAEAQHQSETNQFQWSSFDDSYESFVKWLKDMEKKSVSYQSMKNTLPEKKAALQSFKVYNQDLNSHKPILENLTLKGKQLHSSDIDDKLQIVSSQYWKLMSEAEVLLQELKNGKEKVTDIQKLAATIESESAEKCKMVVQSEVETLNENLTSLITECTDSKESLSQTVQTLQSYDDNFQHLSMWLKDMKMELSDPELMSSLKEKQMQASEFLNMKKEIESKKDDFEELKALCESVQMDDKHTSTAGNLLLNKYTSLCKMAEDHVQTRNHFVQQHEQYEINYSDVKQMLENLKKQLQVCSESTTDNTYEQRLSKVKEIVAGRETLKQDISKVCSMGEMLCPNTALEGREKVRLEIRSLKDDLDSLLDEMCDVLKKLENFMVQWQSVEATNERFYKWFTDVQIQLDNAELQSLLPDKKAHFQNHKILHQDIVSRQQSLSLFIEKYSSLKISTTVPNSIQQPISELQTKYENLLKASKEKLIFLEKAVIDHQIYQEKYQDFLNWLNTSTEKIESAYDLGGDKHSLENKLDKFKEYKSQLESHEKQLQAILTSAKIVEQTTSEDGITILNQEISSVTNNWKTFSNLIEKSSEDLRLQLQQWNEMEADIADFSKWMKECDVSLKQCELKSFLDEKRTHLNTLKEYQSEILLKRPALDALSDKIQCIMHLASDMRVSSQLSYLVTRYQNLVANTKELINKWEKYSADHLIFEGKKEAFHTWEDQINHKLSAISQSIADQKDIDKRKCDIQVILIEKEHGLQKLEALIASGEKLFPDTAGKGREIIRQEIRAARESWDRIIASIAENQQMVNTAHMNWASFLDSQEEILSWIAHIEPIIQQDKELCSTQQEKKNKIQTYKTILEDISLHQRMIDNTIDKAEAILQKSENSEISLFIADIKARFYQITIDTKNLIQKSEDSFKDHLKFSNALQEAHEWLHRNEEQLNLCLDRQGDRQGLETKLKKIQELSAASSQFEVIFHKCDQLAKAVFQTTTESGQTAVKKQLDILGVDWEDYKSKLDINQNHIDEAMSHWQTYDENYDKLRLWLKDTENKVNVFNPKCTLADKEKQLNTYKNLGHEIRSKQSEIDSLADEVHSLKQITPEANAPACTSQLLARFVTVEANTKSVIKKCSQNINDHKEYDSKLASCDKWLQKMQQKLDLVTLTGGSKEDLERNLEKIQYLLQEREEGLQKLNSLLETGEKLIPNTGVEGQDTIRQQNQSRKQQWETLFEDLSECQRKLDLALMQWVSFEDHNSQIDQWLKNVESQIEGNLPLMSTLEEKKLQLQTYKVLQRDVQSYQPVIDRTNQKLQQLMKNEDQSDLSKFSSQVKTRYKKLNDKLKKRIQKYNNFVNNHQEYTDAYNNCIEGLAIIKEKLNLCADFTGDKHAIQHRLRKLQDILATKAEEKPKVKKVIDLSSKVLPNTSQQGKDIITQEVDSLKNDWTAFEDTIAQTKKDLEHCMEQWEMFDFKYELCSAEVKQVEKKLKGTELKNSLEEKEEQLEILSSQLMDETQQDSMENLFDLAQALSQITSDSTIITTVSQLKARKQVVLSNIKDLCRKWEKIVADHHKHQNHYDECVAWAKTLQRKVEDCKDVHGDEAIIQEKIQRIQILMSERDEGLYKLRVATESLKLVLPNTSILGCQKLHKNLQLLQSDYDNLSSEMSNICANLESSLSQWTIYHNELDTMKQWLTDCEVQLKTESELQTSYSEKKLTLDRVMHLKMNINSQKTIIDNLLSKASHDLDESQEADQQNIGVLNRYQNLTASVQQLHLRCQQHLVDAQAYRDAYVDAANWLNLTVETLNNNNEMQGDRNVLEMQLHRIHDVISTLENGNTKISDACSKGKTVMDGTTEEGQKLIQAEINALNEDFAELRKTSESQQTKMENICQQWNEYETTQEELNHWLTNTVTTQKTSADNKYSLVDIEKQLNDNMKYLDDINAKQPVVDRLSEQAAYLMQSVSSAKVACKVAQTTASYSSLANSAKDMVKCSEKISSDYKHFEDSYKAADTWIESMSKKLVQCSNPSKDRDVIEKQLEKLQELIIIKEEGQLLIHTAIMSGEQMKPTVSRESRIGLQTRLETLQTKWDHLVKNMTESKITLETNLLQWSDYNESCKQVKKWLDTMDKRLHQDQPMRIDLVEKKGFLQKMKNIYQDIVSYSAIIDSAINKGQELASYDSTDGTSMDFSKISSQYDSIKELAQAQLSSGELHVAQQQNLNDSVDHFKSWLKTAQESLSVCSDTAGDKPTILMKLSKLKNLFGEVNTGNQLLEQTHNLCEAVLPCTAKLGQVKIQKELQQMDQHYKDFSNSLNDVEIKLQKCVSEWEKFEAATQKFDAWLKNGEKFLCVDIAFKATLEEKKQLLKTYQEYNQEVASNHEELDLLSEHAQGLLQTTSDAAVSYSITQLTSRFQVIINKTKESVKILELIVYQHEVYDKSVSEYDEWLNYIMKNLEPLFDSNITKELAKHNLTVIADLEVSKDTGSTKLQRMLDAANKTLQKTNSAGSKTIRQKCDDCQSKFDVLLVKLTQVKQLQETCVTNWDQYDDANEQMTSLLEDIQNRLKLATGQKPDLAEKCSCLERQKTIQQELISQKSNLKKLESKAERVTVQMAKDSVNETNVLYKSLLDQSQEIVGQLEDMVKIHNDYRQAHTSCMEWINNTRHHLNQINNPKGDIQVIQERKLMFKKIQDSVSQGKELVTKCSVLSGKVCKHTSPQGQSVIKEEMDIIEQNWTMFMDTFNGTEQNLNDLISNWENFHEEYNKLLSWLNGLETNVNSILKAGDDVLVKQSQLEEIKLLLEDVNQKKSSLDKIQELGNQVVQKNNDLKISHQLHQLSSQYYGQRTNIKNEILKLTENIHEHVTFEDSYHKTMEWINSCENELKEINNTKEDGISIQDKLKTLNAIVSAMDEAVHKVNKVHDYAEKIHSSTSAAGNKKNEKKIEELNKKWKQLNQIVTDCAFNLQNTQQKWQDFEVTIETLVSWVTDLESILSIDPEVHSQLSEKTAQLDKYRFMLSEIESKESVFEDLENNLSQLEVLKANSSAGQESLKPLQQSYKAIRHRCQHIIRGLEKSCKEHSAFQTCQKEFDQWLLQTSLKLMSHNTLHVSTMELTEDHVKRHQELMEEIQLHASDLEDIKQKGIDLADSNTGSPDVQKMVDDQIKNLSDGYKNLVVSANQIKEHLAGSFQQWSSHQEELQSFHVYLSETLPKWEAQIDSHPVDNLTEAKEQLANVKEVWNKLYTMKQDLNNSISLNRNTDTTKDEGLADAIANSPLQKFSLEVNQSLVLKMNKVEKKMDSARDVIQSWEAVDTMKNDLRTVLRQKKEELKELEEQPSKLHEEAADIEITKLQILKNEVEEKFKSLNDLKQLYQNLTEHNLQLSDPVIQAIQEDWEETVSHIGNILKEKENEKLDRKTFQDDQKQIDRDLENYAQELERIELDGTPIGVEDKITPAKRCDTTQTADPSARYPGRRSRLNSDSEDDSDTDPFESKLPTVNGASFQDNQPRPSSSRNSDYSKRRYGLDTFSPHSLLKYRSVLLESESEESGYGETNTMQASSFDVTLDNDADFEGYQSTRNLYSSRSEDSMSFVSNHISESADGWIRSIGSQTHCNVRTQTPKDFGTNTSFGDLSSFLSSNLQSCAVQTQTELLHNRSMQTSHTSLHSSSPQTKSLNGSKSELLKNLMLEVKRLKTDSEIDPNLTVSGSVSSLSSSLNGTILREKFNDVCRVQQSDFTREASTQTYTDQGTQTSFSEENCVHPLRHEKLKDVLKDVKLVSNSSLLQPDSKPRDGGLLAQHVPQTNVCQNSLNFPPPQYTNNISSMPSKQMFLIPKRQETSFNGTSQNIRPLFQRKKITQQDLNNVSRRIERLRNNQLPEPHLRTFNNNRQNDTLVESSSQHHPVIPVVSEQIPNPRPSSNLPQFLAQNSLQIQNPIQIQRLPNHLPNGYISSSNSFNDQTPQNLTEQTSCSQQRFPPRQTRRSFRHSYDDLDLAGYHQSRQNGYLPQRNDHRAIVMARYNLDEAIEKVTKKSRQLKKITEKMKLAFKNELLK